MRTRKEIPFTKSDTALALTIPIYAFIGSLIFGEKLTNHHYIVLLPFLPLLFALLSSKLLLIDSKEKFKTKYVVYIFIAIMLTLNVLRFNQFDKHLMLTGGLNKSTYHLNVLSQEALYTGEEVMYFFPDWGFWTSFQTLTGNSIPYEIDTNRETIFKHLSNGKKLRIFVWEKQRILEFEQLVKEVKSNAIISIRERLNYDKSVAFYELSVV
jgi:hypothetical protein